MFVMLKVERGFTLWANGHLTMDVIESAQRSGTRFKFIGQQKDWAFTFDKWGCGVNDYVAFVFEMEPENHLALCNETKQMVKNIVKRATKGLSTSDTWPSHQRLLDDAHSSKKVTLPLLLEISVLWR